MGQCAETKLVLQNNAQPRIHYYDLKNIQIQRPSMKLVLLRTKNHKMLGKTQTENVQKTLTSSHKASEILHLYNKSTHLLFCLLLLSFYFFRLSFKHLKITVQVRKIQGEENFINPIVKISFNPCIKRIIDRKKSSPLNFQRANLILQPLTILFQARQCLQS